MIIGIVIAIVVVIATIAIVGSSTLARRKHLKDIEKDIMDNKVGQESHISGSLLKIKEQIESGKITQEYMSIPSQESIIDLYNYANEHNITNNDMRRQQLIYNFFLVGNQASVPLVLFGNGYMANYRELVLEMEGASFLFNFGIIGFMLYFLPFIVLFVYALIIGIKNVKKIDTQYLMLLSGLACSFALTFLSGYTFFNSSSMIIIICLSVLLLNKIKTSIYNAESIDKTGN